MLLFSTMLNISKKMTKNQFIESVIEWNQNSPHKDNIIEGINWDGSRNVVYTGNNLSLEIEEYRNGNIIAVRYRKIDSDEIVWDTDYVMNFSENRMAIRLDRSYIDSAVSDKQFSTPYYIKLLIDKGYLENDGDLPITYEPIYIGNNDLEKYVDIVNGKRYELPVVYVSKTFQDEFPVDVNRMAKRLKGVAHVLVQESNNSTSDLKRLCAGKNAYNGGINIYYPKQTDTCKQFYYRPYPGAEKRYLNHVVEFVISNANAKLMAPLYTWQGVSQALTKDRLESQKQERAEAEQARRAAFYEIFELKGQQEAVKKEAFEEASRKAKEEVDKILSEFDGEVDALHEQIEKLSRENEKLQAENYGLKIKLDSRQEKPLLYMGTEDEFYPGEIKDLVLSTLDKGLSNIETKTRRHDVIKDIIDSNDYQEISKKRAEETKSLLKNYDRMDARTRKGLEDLGFKITHDGEHYKAYYYGDSRYLIVHGATPEDNRSGRNNVSTTIKKVF